MPWLMTESKQQIKKNFENFLIAQGQGEAVVRLACHETDRIFNYMEDNSIKIEDINFNHLVNFFSLWNPKLKPTTIHIMRHGLLHLFKYLILAYNLNPKVIEDLKLLKVKVNKSPFLIKNTISKEELADIVGKCLSKKRFIYEENNSRLRFKAVTYFLFYTGLRMGEFLNLKRSNFDFKNLKVTVKGRIKNDIEGYAYFPKEVGDLIQAYFKLQPERTNAFNMTELSLRNLFKRLNHFLPPDRRISPHSMRHSFAIMLAEEEVSERVAQRLLRHKDIKTTLIYYNPSAKLVERIYRDNLGTIKLPEVHSKRKNEQL